MSLYRSTPRGPIVSRKEKYDDVIDGIPVIYKILIKANITRNTQISGVPQSNTFYFEMSSLLLILVL